MGRTDETWKPSVVRTMEASELDVTEVQERNQVAVQDEGSERKFFTIVPNLVVELGLSPHALTLYVNLKRTAGENGECFKTRDQLAKITKMSPAKVSEARVELEQAKLIRVEQPSRRQRSVITITDIWAQNMEYFLSRHNMTTEPSQYDDYRKNPSKEEQPPKGGTEPSPAEEEFEAWHIREYIRSELEQNEFEYTRPSLQPYNWAASRLYKRGTDPEDLYEAADRVVSEWPRIRLKLDDALRDIRNGGEPEKKKKKYRSPQVVVEALRQHKDMSRYTPLAAEWDFTSEEMTPTNIEMKLGGDWEERSRNLQRIQSIARRAVREANGT